MRKVQALASGQDLPLSRAIAGTRYPSLAPTIYLVHSTTHYRLKVRIRASHLAHQGPPMTRYTQKSTDSKTCRSQALAHTTRLQVLSQLTEINLSQCFPSFLQSLICRLGSQIRAQAPTESKTRSLQKGATFYLSLKTPVCHSSRNLRRIGVTREFKEIQRRTTQGLELTHRTTSSSLADTRSSMT